MISTKHTIYQARLIRSYLNKEIDQKTYYSRYNIDLEIEAHSRAMFGGSFEDVFVEECRRLGLPSTVSRRQLPGIAAASLAAAEGKQLKRSSPKDTSPVPEKKQKIDSQSSPSPKELKNELKESTGQESPKDHEEESKMKGEETDSKNQEAAKREKKRRTYEEEKEKALRKKKLFPTALPPRELKKLISGSEKRDEIRNSLRELKSGEMKKVAINSASLSEEKSREVTPPPPKAPVKNIVSTPKIPKKKEFAARRQEMKKSDAPVSPPPQASMEASSPIVTTPKVQRNREFALRRQSTVKKAKTPSRLSLAPKPQGAHSPIRQTPSLLSNIDIEQEETTSTLLHAHKNRKRVTLERYLKMKKNRAMLPQESQLQDGSPLVETTYPTIEAAKEITPLPQETIEPEHSSDASEEENEEILPIDEPAETATSDRAEPIEQENTPPQSQETPLDSVAFIEKEPVISPSQVLENEVSNPSQNITESAEECNIYLNDAKDMDTPAPALVESVEQGQATPSSFPEEPVKIPPHTESEPDILQQKQDLAPVAETEAEEIIPSKNSKHQDPLARACAICLCKAPRERVFYTDCGHVSCRACAELILFETGFASSSIRNPQIACPFCRNASGFTVLNEEHTFPEETEEAKKSSRDEYVEVAIREHRIQRFLNGKVSQKQYVESYNKWMKITADRHEKKGGQAQEIYETELKRIQAILPHVKDNANLALGAAEVTWLEDKERLISKLKKENDALSKLKFTDPHRTQYSSACTNCQKDEPRKKFASVSCGHVIGLECAENKRKISCKKCKKPSKAVRIFEHEIRPRKAEFVVLIDVR